MTTVTIEEFRAALERAVEKKGADYVYEEPTEDGPCVYIEPHTDEPSCLIGHALVDLGVGVYELRAIDAGDWAETVADRALVSLGVAESGSPLAAAARAAQSAQDNGQSWGYALSIFNSALTQFVDDEVSE